MTTIGKTQDVNYNGSVIKAMSVAMPSKPLTCADSDYRRSWDTDLAETFRRVREQQRQAEVKFIHVVINNMPEQSK